MLLGIQIFGRKMLSPREMAKALGPGDCDYHLAILGSSCQQTNRLRREVLCRLE